MGTALRHAITTTTLSTKTLGRAWTSPPLSMGTTRSWNRSPLTMGTTTRKLPTITVVPETRKQASVMHLTRKQALVVHLTRKQALVVHLTRPRYPSLWNFH